MKLGGIVMDFVCIMNEKSILCKAYEIMNLWE